MLEVSSIQGRAAHRLRQAARAVALVASLASLAGCQGAGLIGGGEGLFHDLEGGTVALQRPPPPGVNDPYPSLGTIPKRPLAPDIIAEQKIADQLAAQRDQAEQDAAAHPLTPRAAPPPIPKPPATPDPNANRVTVDAAATPPAPVTPVKAAAPAPAAAADIPGLASVPAVPAALVAGPLPSFAAAPPPPPTGLGPIPAFAMPQAAASTTTPALTVPAAAPPAASTTPLLDRLLGTTAVPGPTGDTVIKITPPPVAGSVAVDFTAGSAELPPSAPLSLRRFAFAHRGVPVTVTGHGENVLPGAEPQSRALDLALRRAQAIAASLGTAGVPASNLRIRAEAAGHGGSVNL